jgi:hypothetical protein
MPCVESVLPLLISTGEVITPTATLITTCEFNYEVHRGLKKRGRCKALTRRV